MKPKKTVYNILLFNFVLFLIHIDLIKETEMNKKMKFNVGQPYIIFCITNVQCKKNNEIQWLIILQIFYKSDILVTATIFADWLDNISCNF